MMRHPGLALLLATACGGATEPVFPSNRSYRLESVDGASLPITRPSTIPDAQIVLDSAAIVFLDRTYVLATLYETAIFAAGGTSFLPRSEDVPGWRRVGTDSVAFDGEIFGATGARVAGDMLVMAADPGVMVFRVRPLPSAR